VLHGRVAEAESQAGIVGAAALELARLHALVAEEFVQRVVDAVAVGIRMRAIVGEKKRRGANSAPRRLH